DGYLQLPNGVSSGSFAVASGSQLTLSGGHTLNGATFSGSGTVDFYGGNYAVNLPWTFAGTTLLDYYSTVNFNQAVSSPVNVGLYSVGNFNDAVTTALTVSGGTANLNTPYNLPLTAGGPYQGYSTVNFTSAWGASGASVVSGGSINLS